MVSVLQQPIQLVYQRVRLLLFPISPALGKLPRDGSFYKKLIKPLLIFLQLFYEVQWPAEINYVWYGLGWWTQDFLTSNDNVPLDINVAFHQETQLCLPIRHNLSRQGLHEFTDNENIQNVKFDTCTKTEAWFQNYIRDKPLVEHNQKKQSTTKSMIDFYPTICDLPTFHLRDEKCMLFFALGLNMPSSITKYLWRKQKVSYKSTGKQICTDACSCRFRINRQKRKCL